MRLRFILFFLIALICQCETALVTPRADSAAWLFMGQRQAFGEMPGRDLWDNKLPLIYLIGRLAMFTGHPQVSLWLIEAALTAAGALAVSSIVARVTGTSKWPPLIAGFLLCIVTGAVSYHGGGYMTEIYAMPLSAIAVWCTLRATRPTHGARWAVLSGLLWTLAVSFRLPLGLAAVAVVAYVMLSSDMRRKAAFFGCHMIGIILGAFVIFFHPVFEDYFRYCLDAAILWPLGIGHDRVPGPFTPTTVERLADWGQDVLKLGWLHAAAITGIVMTWRSASGFLTRVTAAWYAAGMISAAWGWASYAHYQYVAFAPMCLAIGLLIASLKPPHSSRLSVLLTVLTTGVVGFQVAREVWRFQTSGEDADKSAAIAYIHDHTRPEDSVLVWAWGRSADVLYRLNRPSGTRHFMAHSYFDMDLTLFDEFSNNLRSDWILEDSRRDKPPLTTNPLKPYSPMPGSLRRVHLIVSNDYQFIASFGPWRVFRRLPPDFLAMPATQPFTP